MNFSKIESSIPIPNLIEVQKRSYERFLQMYTPLQEREQAGLQAVFNSIYPISDFRENCSLEFVDYSIGNWECKCGRLKGLDKLHVGRSSAPGAGEPAICDECGDKVSLQLKYDVEESQERGMNFTLPLKVTVRLVVYEKSADGKEKSIRDIKEQEVYFGEIPLLTDKGTFIINGTERVIVSQLHRSPGVFFQASEDRSVFMAKVIPYRGSWVEFEYDAKNIIHVRIDRKRKFLGSVFLRVLGLSSDEEILASFYRAEKIDHDGKKFMFHTSEGLVGLRAAETVVDPRKKDTLVRKGKKITRSILKALQKSRIKKVQILEESVQGARALRDVIDKETGEVLVEVNTHLTPEHWKLLAEKRLRTIDVFFPENDEIGTVLAETLEKDTVTSTEEALLELYRRLRPGDPPTLESARNLFESMFFDLQRYDLSRVGRLKFNAKLGAEVPLEQTILTKDDFLAVIRCFLKLRRNPAGIDDIDHLGNRRVRSVGELLENQFRIGLVRMERAIKEKMSVYQEMTTAMPHDLINAKPVMAAIQEFFGSSQLSQFMDQTNPLSEVTHKRRLSALGPGGLSRERAGFEVRDVHPTHYGRICPIETPEGPNIGLISSLSCYARINEYGFIETPYLKVQDGRVREDARVLEPGHTDFKAGQVVSLAAVQKANRTVSRSPKRAREAVYEPAAYYLSAWEEDHAVIAQANAKLDENGCFMNERVTAREAGEFKFVERDKVDYIDVSPRQLVSVAASLIPFLENDDANRALMGSNMQRQAVPLLRTEAPFVGTGMEAITARDSGAVVIARRTGIVDSVDAQRITVRVEGKTGKAKKGEYFGADIYSLVKFKRSNQNTCINQKPLVRVGDRVEKGQVLADGTSIDRGELALGRNVLVAFMPWRGYNFEDAILISERLVKEDYYTSIHIAEFETEARDTKLGPEEITRDIPNVSEDFICNLDESGIIRIGARVKPGDILVGKITPKGETQLTPEEKLLRAIFGEKSGDVRDASLNTPPGIEGTVVDVKIFCRKGVEKDSRNLAIEQEQIARMEKNLSDEIRILKVESRNKLMNLAEGECLAAGLKSKRTRNEILPAKTKLTWNILQELSDEDLARIEIKPKKPEVLEEFDKVLERAEKKIHVLKKLHAEKIAQMKKGDELAPGVIKMVKVYVAMKRKLSVGDKMAGRHGNKGVIARILPEEDMPYLPDGTPVDVVLNPLGVPSRMNVGQVLETHLGWAASKLGRHYAAPVFDGASEKEIKDELERAGLPLSGKTLLYDGKTGQPFEQEVTVGFIYLMKLSHLVDDKIHARSIGPYSLITQQPLGGKAQFGGQRFGEMEVWALESYGAAHTLQELLTVKSDDVYGRTKIYEALVKGETTVEPGLPESFNVLVRELQSLCLDVTLQTKN
ncbi:MAG: DNA-directed RNA polymerase subunit beta [Acidobacteriota bacterium]